MGTFLLGLAGLKKKDRAAHEDQVSAASRNVFIWFKILVCRILSANCNNKLKGQSHGSWASTGPAITGEGKRADAGDGWSQLKT